MKNEFMAGSILKLIAIDLIDGIGGVKFILISNRFFFFLRDFHTKHKKLIFRCF